MTGITIPITKNNYLVKFAEDLPSVLEEAWMLVTNGRHGPVLVDIAKDVFAAEIPKDARKQPMIKPYVPKPIGENELDRCVRELEKAKRPLILAGGGANKTLAGAALLNELASLMHIPAVNTLMGKGAWKSDAPYYMGMVGMHGLPSGNIALRRCDLLITLGSRYSDRVVGKPSEIQKDRTILQVDIDNAEFAKTLTTALSIQADTTDFLEALLARLKKQEKRPDFTEPRRSILLPIGKRES